MAIKTIGILGGTGPQGRGLALRFAQVGYHCIIGSRDAERAAAAVERVNTKANGAEPLPLTGSMNDEAATQDLVVVAVPYDGLARSIPPLAERIGDRIAVSCVNRLAFDDIGPHPIPVPAGSAAEELQQLLPRARVVGAFHHIPAGLLARPTEPLDMDIAIVGDDRSACAEVANLAESIPDLRGIHIGPLRLARPIEEMTAALVAVNRRYDVRSGLRITGLPEPRALA